MSANRTEASSSSDRPGMLNFFTKYRARSPRPAIRPATPEVAHSPIRSSQAARLRKAVDKWKADAGAALTPLMEQTERTAYRALGIAEILDKQEHDLEGLSSRLASVTEKVLNRAGARSGEDRDLQECIDALARIVVTIQDFLDEPVSMARQLVDEERTAKVHGFIKDIDAFRLRYLEAHADNMNMRVVELETKVEELSISLPPLPLIDRPAKPKVFYGRDALVTTIVQSLLKDAACRIPLLGTGGIGKTTVAASVINNKDIKAKYDENIFFVSCEGVVSADGVVGALAALCGRNATFQSSDLVLAELAARGTVLLVLDNLETPLQSADSERVERLLERLGDMPHLSLVVTLRGSLPPSGVDWENIEPLEKLGPEAARSIWTSAGLASDDRLDDLLQRLDGLPLAIQLVARQTQLMKLSASEMLAIYEREETKVVKTGGASRLKSLEVSIQLSLESPAMKQNPQALKMFSVLCVLPDGAPRDMMPIMLPSMAESVVSIASSILDAALASLEGGRMKILSPIRDFILAKYPPPKPLLDDLRQYFMDLVKHHPIHLRAEFVDRRVVDFGNINGVLQYLWKTSSESEITPALIDATIETADFASLASIGDASSLLREARRRLQSIGNLVGEARCTLRLGDRLRMQMKYDESTELLEDAKRIFHSLSNTKGEAKCTYSMGVNLCMVGKFDQARVGLSEARRMFQSIGDQLDEARCMYRLGDVLKTQGKQKEAYKMLNDARHMFRSFGEIVGEAQCWQSMADVQLLHGKYETALTMVEGAERRFREGGDRLGVAQCVHSRGDLLAQLGRLGDAVPALDEAEQAFRAIGDWAGVAACMRGRANILYLQSNYGQATSLLGQASDSLRTLGHRLDEGNCLVRLGDTLREMGEYERAGEVTSKAKSIFDEIGYKSGLAEALHIWGQIYWEQGLNEDARVCYLQARDLYEEMNLRKQVKKCDASLNACDA